MSALRNFLESRGAARNEPLSKHTFLGIGGPADWYLTVDSSEALEAAARAARQEDCPILALGAGTNTLAGDRGFRGLAIKQNPTNLCLPPHRAADEYAVIEAGAGVQFTTLSRRTGATGWRGLEWAEGIPGSMGGAVVYNAGAYGGDLAQSLIEIDCIAPDGSLQQLEADELRLGYRSSDFTRGLRDGWIVTRIRLRLQRGTAQNSLKLIHDLAERRTANAPKGQSGGSTFRNPPNQRAWELIDRVGLRGHRIGDAQISEQHCNYFMNVGRATAGDMTALIRLAQQRVSDQFGIRLEPELTSVGEGFE